MNINATMTDISMEDQQRKRICLVQTVNIEKRMPAPNKNSWTPKARAFGSRMAGETDLGER